VNTLIAWFARNRVAANLLMLVMIVGGISALFSIPLKIFPDLDLNIVTVTVPYLGAAPEEVEAGVCVRIEEAIESVEGIDTLHSTASEGRCLVVAELLMSADPNLATDRIKSRVDAITTLPEQTEKPIVSKLTIRRRVIDVAVSGNTDERTLKHIGERIRDDITSLPGITQVDLLYDRPYEISIEVPEESLRRYGLTFDQVAQAVRQFSLDLPGGTIRTRGGDVLIRTTGQAYRGDEFQDIVVITREDGTRVTLGQIARIVDGFNESEIAVHFDDEPAVLLRTYRVGEQDSINISDQVQTYVETEQQLLPEGIKLTVWADASKSLRGRIDTLVRNGRSGIFLVILLLALFLRFRVAFWVSAGIPVAFLGALSIMPLLGLSIDVISLFAFIVVLGIVVDDAIVVGENIHSHQQAGDDPVLASIRGTQEVTVPVIFGVLTTVAAFFPLLMVPGPMGQVYAVIGYVVIACLLFSLVESQLVLPAHLAHMPKRQIASMPASATQTSTAENPARGWTRVREATSRWLERMATTYYEPWLERALRRRYTALAIGVALILLTIGLVKGGRMGFSYFPPIGADYITASVTLPRGTPFSVTEKAVAQLESSALELRQALDGAPPNTATERPLSEAAGKGGIIRHILTSIGTQGKDNRHDVSIEPTDTQSHLGEVVIELAPSEERTLSGEEIANRWRELTGTIPEAIELTYSASRGMAGEAINIQFRGRDIEALRAASLRLQQHLARFPGVMDITDSFRGGKQEIKLSLKPGAESLGLNLRDLARQVRQAFYGEEAQRVQRGRDDIRVMVRYPEQQRKALTDLENMWIRTLSGNEAPFYSVADVQMSRGFASIQRTDRKRVINVTAEVDRSRTNANKVIAQLEQTVLPEILRDFRGLSYSFEGEQREQRRSLGGIMRSYALALFAIYALLAIPLRSYVQPLIIMSVIPFGVVGAIAGHLLMHKQLSFMSLIGMVALSGVVVNDSLVLVDFINRRRASGVSLEQAVREAARSRFRPILLTSLTTFAGLSPLLIERSIQSQYLVPMAISLAFGVLFATLITLILVPCMLLALEDLRGGPRHERNLFPQTSSREGFGRETEGTR